MHNISHIGLVDTLCKEISAEQGLNAIYLPFQKRSSQRRNRCRPRATFAACRPTCVPSILYETVWLRCRFRRGTPLRHHTEYSVRKSGRRGVDYGAAHQCFTAAIDDSGHDGTLCRIFGIWWSPFVQRKYVRLHIFQSVVVWFRPISDLNTQRY